MATSRSTAGTRASAREAVVRIVDESTATDKISRVEVYAEGQVRAAGAENSPHAKARFVVRGAEVRLKCYQPGRPVEVKSPPWELQIIRRSGLREPAATAAARPTRGATDRSGGPARSSMDLVSAPSPGSRDIRPPPAEFVPVVATQAVVTNPQATPAVAAAPSARASSDDDSPGPDAAARRRSQAAPKRDTMVQRAAATENSAPVASSAGTSTRVDDPQVQQTSAQQVPPTNAQPPTIDLPPIEGAPPEVQVPNLTPKPDDVPRDLQPLPGPDGSLTVPNLRDRRRTPRDGKPPPEPPVVPIMPGSQRITRISTRSGRPLDSNKLPDTPDGVETWIVRGGINIVTRPPKSGTIDIEADEAVIWRGPDPKKGEPVDRAQRRDLGRRRQSADGGLPRRQRGPPPGREQVRRQGRPADRPRSAALLRLSHRPHSGAQCRDRHVRPVAAGSDQDQVATDRAVSPADAAAQRDVRPRRAARDPRRAGRS